MGHYNRVIPRDLFNEAGLLKCLGRVYINLETTDHPNAILEHDGEAFDIRQSVDDGSISAVNVVLLLNGDECRLWRPLNSRESWPLYATVDDDEIEVFDDTGNFTVEFLAVLS